MQLESQRPRVGDETRLSCHRDALDEVVHEPSGFGCRTTPAERIAEQTPDKRRTTAREIGVPGVVPRGIQDRLTLANTEDHADRVALRGW